MKKTFMVDGISITLTATTPEKIQDGRFTRNQWGILASSKNTVHAVQYTGPALSVAGADKLNLNDVLFSMLRDAESVMYSEDVFSFMEDFGYLPVDSIDELRKAAKAYIACENTLQFFLSAGLSKDAISAECERLES